MKGFYASFKDEIWYSLWIISFQKQWEDPEGSGEEGGGRGDRGGEYIYIHGWSMSMSDKNHYNIVK